MPGTTNGDFDDLLDTPPTEEEKKNLEVLKADAPPAESPEQARIRELEEKIAALTEAAKTPVIADLQAEVEKTPAEKAKEHAIAVQENQKAVAAQPVFDEADEEEDIVFHVLVNGLTIGGAVRHPGETVRIRKGSQAYELATDRTGYNWLDDISDGGLSHYGKVVLGVGPFGGTQPDDDLARAEANRRGGSLTRVI